MNKMGEEPREKEGQGGQRRIKTRRRRRCEDGVKEGEKGKTEENSQMFLCCCLMQNVAEFLWL